MTQETIVREKEMINYVGMPRLYLETADRRLFEHPYGPRYNDAVGKIFQDAGESERKVAFVRSIVPQIFTERIGGADLGEIVPIEVFSQVEHEDGVILTVKINYSRPHEDSFDPRNRNGQWLILILYPESASRLVIGKRD